MKKLIAMIAAAVMGFAYGDATEIKNVTGFEQAAGVLDTTKTDAGSDTGDKFWFGGDELAEIKGYGDDAKYAYTGAAPVPVTDWVAPGTNYLALDSGSTALYRTISANSGALPETGTDIGDGLFFDSLVKFTVTEYDPTVAATVDPGTKLAVWLGQAESDEGNEPTNLIVTAAIWDANAGTAGKYVATNFVATTSADITDGAWHRVTARAIKTVADGAAGFTLFIDGLPVSYAATPAALLDPSVDATAEATILIGKNQLFLNLMSGEAERASLVGFGFKGTGSIDDVSITDKANAPLFAKGQKQLTVSWDANVDSITINDNALDLTGKESDVVMLDEMTGNTIAVTYKTDFVKGAWEFDGATVDGTTLTLTTEVASIDIASAAEMFQVGANKYGTFDEARDAAADAAGTISLVADYAPTGFTTSQIGNGDDKNVEIVIDLNGKNFTVDFAGQSIFNVATGSTLKLIDSVGGGVLTGRSTAPKFVVFAGTPAIIGDAGESDKGAAIVGEVGAASLVKGDFDKDNNDDEGLAELLADPDNFEITSKNDNFWTVSAAEPAGPFEGAGTEDDPFIIASEADLNKLAELLADTTTAATYNTAYYKQTENIPMTEAFVGIGGLQQQGDKTDCFKGYYDGNGKEISNLIIAKKSGDSNRYRGLFNSVAGGAVISNLTVTITGMASDAEVDEYSAGLIGFSGTTSSTILDATVVGCTVKGAVNVTGNVGGIACRAYGNMLIKDTVVDLDITVKPYKNNTNAKIGGFIGSEQNRGELGKVLENCQFTGSITVKAGSSTQGVAAFIAFGTAKLLKNCSAVGAAFSFDDGAPALFGQVCGNDAPTAVEGDITVNDDAIVLGSSHYLDGLNFATVDAGVATLISTNAFVKDNTYKVMANGVAGEVFALAAEGDTIAFDLSLVNDACNFTVGAASGLEAQPVLKDHVVTFTAVKAAGEDWPETPADVEGTDAKTAFPDLPAAFEGADAGLVAAWAKGKGNLAYADMATASIDAFLLDCAESEVETEAAKFKIVSIENINGEWVVKVTGEKAEGENYTVNAKVDIVPYEITGASDGAGFFKAKLVPFIVTK